MRAAHLPRAGGRAYAQRRTAFIFRPTFPQGIVHRSRRLFCSLSLLLAGCHRGQTAAEVSQQAEEPVRPFAQLASQRVILAPTHSLLGGDPLGWAAEITKPREYLKSLDSTLATALGERGLSRQWTYPADLVRAMKANPSYAVDPYSLGTNVLRNHNLQSGAKLGDPLVTQLRTMVALQEGARAVLVPVELRFEKDPTGTAKGVATLRVALLDGRLGDVRWIGTIRSDPSNTLSPAVLSSLAAHFADLITSP
jgi:hypothetical protein